MERSRDRDPNIWLMYRNSSDTHQLLHRNDGIFVLAWLLVYECTYVEFHVRLSQRTNEIKSNRSEGIQCEIHCDIVRSGIGFNL